MKILLVISGLLAGQLLCAQIGFLPFMPDFPQGTKQLIINRDSADHYVLRNQGLYWRGSRFISGPTHDGSREGNLDEQFTYNESNELEYYNARSRIRSWGGPLPGYDFVMDNSLTCDYIYGDGLITRTDCRYDNKFIRIEFYYDKRDRLTEKRITTTVTTYIQPEPDLYEQYINDIYNTIPHHRTDANITHSPGHTMPDAIEVLQSDQTVSDTEIIRNVTHQKMRYRYNRHKVYIDFFYEGKLVGSEEQKLRLNRQIKERHIADSSGNEIITVLYEYARISKLCNRITKLSDAAYSGAELLSFFTPVSLGPNPLHHIHHSLYYPKVNYEYDKRGYLKAIIAEDRWGKRKLYRIEYENE